ncbi:hypothetical protein ACH347_06840 [Saccharopolyspora sp. 5N102]|uniref:hypothetical protein n=1 Tax=Saccharopolyspora sp. 5N102 TaxID=3375155 RepID=UPI00378C020D
MTNSSAVRRPVSGDGVQGRSARRTSIGVGLLVGAVGLVLVTWLFGDPGGVPVNAGEPGGDRFAPPLIVVLAWIFIPVWTALLAYVQWRPHRTDAGGGVGSAPWVWSGSAAWPCWPFASGDDESDYGQSRERLVLLDRNTGAELRELHSTPWYDVKGSMADEVHLSVVAAPGTLIAVRSPNWDPLTRPTELIGFG